MKLEERLRRDATNLLAKQDQKSINDAYETMYDAALAFERVRDKVVKLDRLLRTLREQSIVV